MLTGVIESCLDCFLSGGELYLFQYSVTEPQFVAQARGRTRTFAASDPTECVLHCARGLLENGFGLYNIFKNKCEDFAIYCKTGLLVVTNINVGRSGQAASFIAAITAIVSSPLQFMTTSFTGLSAVIRTVYCLSQIVSDVGVRCDVKIPVERLTAESTTDGSESGANLESGH